MIVFPPAKINIGLHVLQKRADGYHDIESIFYPLPLCDILEAVKIKHGQPAKLTVTGLDSGCKPEDNMVMKAYQLMASRYRISPVDIHLHKNIPTGAGLGGGSADGAFMLFLINSLFNLKLSKSQLEQLSLELGSDCPFFIHSEPMLVRGRGEKLKRCSLSLKGYTILIIKPPLHISTPEAYSIITPHANRQSPGILIHQPVSKWKDSLHNDFFNPLAIRYSVIAEIREMMYKAGAEYASLSGSGSAIYGLFRNVKDAEKIVKPDCFRFIGQF